jgi:DNA-binding transcriptional regulator YdaS (Cro superfamily)
MTEEQARKTLRAAVDEAGGQRAFAKLHGFSAAYVNDVLKGRRALADHICKAIGVTRFVTYTTNYVRQK